ncbi:hypothetical protein NX794_26045 [Streptomyces sp. LP11]|uniref:Uncharacterized protein n=1 Tax=Streptomyces pyxinicus TaxID=2970331 RepID=A0ABT2B995_9ACTN|nr:hypothetical protein [Streptomyces sp. LP11]MCS0604650.1 hypothetical protein [Streptomyces sp. LP11]
MRADIAWWDLDGTGQTIDSLRADLCDATVAAWSEVPGLRLKFWLADRENNRWGAVMLWEADRPDELPPNRAAQLIGGPPAHRGRFDVEATAGAAHELPRHGGPGTAFTANTATSGDEPSCTNTSS